MERFPPSSVLPDKLTYGYFSLLDGQPPTHLSLAAQEEEEEDRTDGEAGGGGDGKSVFLQRR